MLTCDGERETVAAYNVSGVASWRSRREGYRDMPYSVIDCETDSDTRQCRYPVSTIKEAHELADNKLSLTDYEIWDEFDRCIYSHKSD